MKQQLKFSQLPTQIARVLGKDFKQKTLILKRIF